MQALVDRQIPVKALVRNLDLAKNLFPPQVELVLGDVLKPDTLKNAIAGCTVLICATGAKPSLDFTGPLQVDYFGTKNLVDIAKSSGIKQFVLVTSLCVSQFFHPLNLFWLILFWKQQAENYLKESGLTYTIVRPGGLKNEDNTYPIVMSSADTLFEGNIPRQKVAHICVESLLQPTSRNKIVEIVCKADAPAVSDEQLFAQV